MIYGGKLSEVAVKYNFELFSSLLTRPLPLMYKQAGVNQRVIQFAEQRGRLHSRLSAQHRDLRAAQTPLPLQRNFLLRVCG